MQNKLQIILHVVTEDIFNICIYGLTCTHILNRSIVSSQRYSHIRTQIGAVAWPGICDRGRVRSFFSIQGADYFTPGLNSSEVRDKNMYFADSGCIHSYAPYAPCMSTPLNRRVTQYVMATRI